VSERDSYLLGAMVPYKLADKFAAIAEHKGCSRAALIRAMIEALVSHHEKEGVLKREMSK
jgi:hypothetical protein